MYYNTIRFSWGFGRNWSPFPMGILGYVFVFSILPEWIQTNGSIICHRRGYSGYFSIRNKFLTVFDKKLSHSLDAQKMQKSWRNRDGPNNSWQNRDKLSKIYQNTPKYTKIHQNIPKYTKIFKNIPKHYNMERFEHTPTWNWRLRPSDFEIFGFGKVTATRHRTGVSSDIARERNQPKRVVVAWKNYEICVY